MDKHFEIPNNSFTLSFDGMADLLGIHPSELLKLEHSALQAIHNTEGDISEFIMYISPSNDSKVLKKIKIDKHNHVRFAPEEIYVRC